MVLEKAAAVASSYARATSYVLAETLWPTRCVICESPGALLCNQCACSLLYLDQWLACPHCAAPYGLRQCTECNTLSLDFSGLSALPFESCVSAVLFNDDAAKIVRSHKDAGERGLADVMAYAIACAIPPEWIDGSAVVPIPATIKAKKSRGFDHGFALGLRVAEYLGLPCVSALVPGKAKDQRGLGRKQRFENALGVFQMDQGLSIDKAILVDDVFTTGATLSAAALTLREAGVETVRCATYARVY